MGDISDSATGGSIKGLLELCHTAAAGGTGDGCTGMDCGSQSCVLTCPCTPNRPNCHDPSCNQKERPWFAISG